MKYDLEQRLVKFTVKVSQIAYPLTRDLFGKHLSMQLFRSASSAALNYGEAQGAESRKDFIHKLKIVLKELRESKVCLKIIAEMPISSKCDDLPTVLKENDELIAIFIRSIETSKKKLLATK